MNTKIAVTHNADHHRYEVHVSGRLAGFARYQLPDDDHVDFTHTQIDDVFSGQGLAGQLVTEAIADVQRQGKRVIPHCPYVAKWLGERRAYDAIVDPPS